MEGFDSGKEGIEGVGRGNYVERCCGLRMMFRRMVWGLVRRRFWVFWEGELKI